VAGFCCFPWVYGTANLLLVWKPIAASAQGAVQGWFCNGFLLLWLLPVSLGALYGLLPRLHGRHLSHRNLAPLGFWLLILLGGWSGLGRLIGGPIPAWMCSAGIVAGVMLLIPVLIAVINLSASGRGSTSGPCVAAGFLGSGLSLLLAAAILGACLSLPGVSAFARFTSLTASGDLLWLFGAVSFPLFGVLYLAIPPMLGRDGWHRTLSDLHYWLAFSGLCLMSALLVLDGLVAGLALLDPVVSFLNITSFMQPFHVLECAVWLFLLLPSALIVTVHFTGALASGFLFPKK